MCWRWYFRQGAAIGGYKYFVWRFLVFFFFFVKQNMAGVIRVRTEYYTVLHAPSRDSRERWLLRWSRFTKCLYHVSACRSYRKVCCGGLDWSRAKPDTFLSTSMSGRSLYQGSGVAVISPSPARFPSSSRRLWKNCRSSCPRSHETSLTGDFEGVGGRRHRIKWEQDTLTGGTWKTQPSADQIA